MDNFGAQNCVPKGTQRVPKIKHSDQHAKLDETFLIDVGEYLHFFWTSLTISKRSATVNPSSFN